MANRDEQWAETLKIMEQRGTIHQLIIESLAHYDREQAMSFILSWFSIAELEKIAPTLTGVSDIVTKMRSSRNLNDLAAVEFGYRQCEKGMNLQAALEAARNA